MIAFETHHHQSSGVQIKTNINNKNEFLSIVNVIDMLMYISD